MQGKPKVPIRRGEQNKDLLYLWWKEVFFE